MPRETDPSHLHPAAREAILGLAADLAQANSPLKPFEMFRSPERQVDLYARGRGVGTPGAYATKARAWMSLHCYGLACDFVASDSSGNWTWPPASDPMWSQLVILAEKRGLHGLSFEKPHVELNGVMLADLETGRFPAGGDDSWLSNLEATIERWGQASRNFAGIIHPAAPPLLSVLDRPVMI